MYRSKGSNNRQSRFSSAEKIRKTITPPRNVNGHNSFLGSSSAINLSSNKLNKSRILFGELDPEHQQGYANYNSPNTLNSEKKYLSKAFTSETLHKNHGLPNESNIIQGFNYNNTNGTNGYQSRAYTNSPPHNNLLMNLDPTNVIKCKIHNENYAFLHLESKNLFCIDCIYSSNDNQPKFQKPHVIPLKSAMDFITQENKAFLKKEVKPGLLRMERAINSYQRANNLLIDKLKVYENLVTMEFKEIYDYLQKRELEIRNYVQVFFNKKTNEINNKINNITFLQDHYKKYCEIHESNSEIMEIFKFNYANALKKSSKSIDYNSIKFKEDDLHILDFYNKKRIKYEIDAFGKTLNKTLLEFNNFGNHGHNNQYHSNVKSNRQNSSSKGPSLSTSPERNSVKNNLKKKNTEEVFNVYGLLRRGSVINKELFPGTPKKNIDTSRELGDILASLEKENLIFAESRILKDKAIQQEAYDLFPFKFKSAKLLYSIRHNSASSGIFHERCDGRAPYLVIIQAEKDCIFGYFSPVNFVKEEKYSASDQSWIFALKNPHNKQMIFKIKPEKNFIALYNSLKSPCLGSTIKGKEDLFIDFDDLSNSKSNVGYAYRNTETKIDGSTILCGKKDQWIVNDVEIFHVDY